MVTLQTAEADASDPANQDEFGDQLKTVFVVEKRIDPETERSGPMRSLAAPCRGTCSAAVALKPVRQSARIWKSNSSCS